MFFANVFQFVKTKVFKNENTVDTIEVSRQFRWNFYVLQSSAGNN